jgi:hypothetical protein
MARRQVRRARALHLAGVRLQGNDQTRHYLDCSAPRSFFVSFRLSTLTGGAAIDNARPVYESMTRLELPLDGVRCRRSSRTRRTCRVGTYAGDTSIYGRIALWSKRPPGVRSYDLVRYRATLRTYNEDCHLVHQRPRSECNRPYRRRTGWAHEMSRSQT